MTARILVGDCVEAMGAMSPDSIDAIVTDPPYGLGFMGVKWDTYAAAKSRVTRVPSLFDHVGGNHNPTSSADATRTRRIEAQRFEEAAFVWACAMLRVVKPGAYLLAFGGTRTAHRLASAIEDAGWEIRDTLCWMYGSGFPKSHNGAWGGTALKPGYEPIILARKSIDGTVASNHAVHGVGGLNIDACRIEGDPGPDLARVRGVSSRQPGWDRPWKDDPDAVAGCKERRAESAAKAMDLGRWPANVVIDEEAAAAIDEQTGILTSGANPERRSTDKTRNTFGSFPGQESCRPARGADAGGASRFYYCAKASRKEREFGLDESFDRKPLNWSSGEASTGTFQSDGTTRDVRNHHPTVKPIALMRWLCRLVTPFGGTVLDPFAGSGSTGCAAVAEGLSFVGVELNPEYAKIAEARIAAFESESVEATA